MLQEYAGQKNQNVHKACKEVGDVCAQSMNPNYCDAMLLPFSLTPVFAMHMCCRLRR
jgi:hypothetical protein